MTTRRLTDAGRFWLLYAALIAAVTFGVLWTVNARTAVTGEWRVNLIRGSTTVQPASVGATQEAAWTACQARIPKTATTSTSYKCQTPVYAAVVTPDPAPTCPAPPAPTTRPQDCPTGTTGTWTQTSASTVGAPPACTVSTTWSPSSPPAGACVTPVPPLTAPTLTGQRNATTTTAVNALSWTAVAGADSYVIERCPAAGIACPTLSPIATVTGLRYDNTNLPATISYSYRVQPKEATRVGPYSNTWTPSIEPPTTGTTAVRINVGGPAIADYTADQYFVGGSLSTSCNRTMTGVFTTRRYSSTSFEYHIPLTNGAYAVRLLWHECWHTAAGQRVLSATVEGQAIPAFDTWGTNGAAITHERAVTVADGVLNIALTAITGDAMLNAIEVSPAGTQPPPPGPAGEAKISWVPPTKNIDGTALTNLASYNLFWSSVASPNQTKIVISNPAQTQYTLTNLAPGGYSFIIQACNSAGTCGVVTDAATRVVP